MQESQNNDLNNLLVREILQEKRADRRWRNIRFIAWFGLFTFAFLFAAGYIDEPGLPKPSAHSKYAALIRLDGMIAPGHDFSAAQVLPILEDAFSDRHAEGVVIDINSPGGTPVQSSIIHDAIIAYKKKYHKKVIVVGEDMLTSGAYYVAVAADRVYVNPNTITGSVGVIMKGFGFVDAMKKVGIERRVYISGNEKDRLDPFLPQSPEDLLKVQEVMREVHKNFENIVLVDRKGKLHADPASLFNGDFWSGTSAMQLGLVDGVGNLMDVMETEFKTTQFKEYGGSNNFLKVLGNQLSTTFDMLFYA